MDIKEMKKVIIQGIEDTFDEFVNENEYYICEEDKAVVELSKQRLLYKILDELKEENDIEFAYSNLKLYKDMYKAMFREKKEEILKVSSLLLKAYNEWRLDK